MNEIDKMAAKDAAKASKTTGLRLVWSKPEPKKLEIPMLSRHYELLYGRRIK